MGIAESRRYRDMYVERTMACLAVALLLLATVFRLWPVSSTERSLPAYIVGEHDVVALEEIQPTTQAASLRPPPPPLPPIAVEDPYELEFEEPDLDFDMTLPEIAGPPSTGRDQIGDQPPGTRVAAEAARPVRFVEPEYTRDARRRNVRAQIVVEVTVDELGRVADSRILERYLFTEAESSPRPVAQIGFGLEESALSAADRFLFRPAQYRGEAVRSRYQLRFSFGV